jgi:hypothetical protein
MHIEPDATPRKSGQPTETAGASSERKRALARLAFRGFLTHLRYRVPIRAGVSVVAAGVSAPDEIRASRGRIGLRLFR